MATTEAFGRLVCKCDVCGRVWMPDGNRMPTRCADMKKAHRKWNSGESMPAQASTAKNVVLDEPAPVKGGYSPGQDERPAWMCIHRKERKFCVYCQITEKQVKNG